MEKFRKPNWLALEQKTLKIKTDGKSLIELTAYQGIALWWIIRFRLYHSARSRQLINLVIKNTYLFSLVDFLYDFFTAILCSVLSSFFKVKTHEKRPRVLITAHDRDWKNARDPTGGLRKCDIFFDSLIHELKKRDYRIITLTPLKYSISAVKKMIEKLRSQKNTVHKEFNMYWSIKTWKKGHDANRHFRNVWKNVSKDDKNFIESLEKYPLASELDCYFNSIFGYVIKYIEMAKELIEEEEPDLILVKSEYGAFEKALVVAGRLKKIPTLAIQHGSVGPLHKGYMYSKNAISASGSIKSPYCPIPDKTAVYGPNYYDLLTKMSSYPPSSVVITGQPRYDVLAVADRVYSREKFCNKLNLDPDRKIVLVATENLPIPEGKAFLRTVLKALKNFPDIQTVVKPHPGERGEWYKEVLREENVGAVVLSKGADTFKALYACDLFLTGFSTIITEAIILGKTGVTVHIGKREDPTPYYRDVTLRIYREENLVPAIREALYDEKTREKLKKAGKKFVYQHAYKQDGRATERVADLIEEMIKGKQ